VDLLHSGVLVGSKNEVQPPQGVHGLMAELLHLEELIKSAVKLLQLGLLNLSGNHIHKWSPIIH